MDAGNIQVVAVDGANRGLQPWARSYGNTVYDRDALDRFKQNRGSIDLVILDIIMPGMNGKEAFDKMKPSIPLSRRFSSVVTPAISSGSGG